MRREGIQPGVSDLFLSVPRHTFHGLYLEAKHGKGRQSDHQKAFQAAVTEEGYLYVLFSTFEAFQTIVTDYLHG
jgi:hypothetical protein